MYLNINKKPLLTLLLVGLGAFLSGALNIHAQICSTASFSTLPSISISGGSLKAVEIADFDRDGKNDLAVLRDFGGSADAGVVEIWRGNGSGGFTSTGVLYAASVSAPKAFTIGDINNDGLIDLIVAGRFDTASDWRVSILRGNGNGTFQPRTTFTVGNEPRAIAVGDFNNDNNLDIATANYSGGDVSILPATGGGNFNTAISIQGIANADSIKLKDFNNDGRLDFVATSIITDLATVKLNNGNFTFTNAPGTPVSLPDPVGVTIGDFNGDGKSDFAAANRTDQNVSVRLSNGNGTFARPSLDPFAVANGSSPRSVASADFNGDGKSDVVIGNITNAVFVQLGGDGGNLGNFTAFTTESGTATFVTTGDLDNNSSADIAVINDAATNKISLLRNNCPVRRKFDADGDGRADVAVFRPSNGTWYLNNSQTGFTAAAFGISSDKLVPADYDGDGKTDIAVFRPSNGTWYLQRSSLGFTGVAFGDFNDIPVPADYDGDGKTDIAVFRPSNGTWYLQQSTNGFTGVAFGISTDKPVPADYDGDGKADIAVNRTGTWYINRSQLGFYGVQFGAADDKLVPADYDGDGKTDIAVFRPSNGTWYLQQSSFGFTGIAFGTGTDLPVPADYDGDGRADVAVYRDGSWYLQRSSQGFTGIPFGAPTDKPLPNAFVR